MKRGSLAVLAMVLVGSTGCATSTQSMSGEEVADTLVNAMHSSQFYKSATRAECQAVEVKAGAISDCTVGFKRGIYMGDTARKHPVRVTFDDAEGHFSYWVGG
jgi:hypothetical protein